MHVLWWAERSNREEILDLWGNAVTTRTLSSCDSRGASLIAGEAFWLFL